MLGGASWRAERQNRGRRAGSGGRRGFERGAAEDAGADAGVGGEDEARERQRWMGEEMASGGGEHSSGVATRER
jgi:hypothetical protein